MSDMKLARDLDSSLSQFDSKLFLNSVTLAGLPKLCCFTVILGF